MAKMADFLSLDRFVVLAYRGMIVSADMIFQFKHC